VLFRAVGWAKREAMGKMAERHGAGFAARNIVDDMT